MTGTASALAHLVVCVIAAVGAGGCTMWTTASEGPTAMRYVALGDSYTIGTAIAPTDRWPDQLVAALGPEPPTLELVANLGVNGFTSADLIRDELPALADLDPDIVTVLIGVNDVVQGVPTAVYEANVATILDTLLARLPPERIVTVSIPDYTVTPSGGDYGAPTQQHDAIVSNNAIMERLSAERRVAFVDIFDISLASAWDRSLVADDGLHPSGVQYGRWVERIRPVVGALLAP